MWDTGENSCITWGKAPGPKHLKVNTNVACILPALEDALYAMEESNLG